MTEYIKREDALKAIDRIRCEMHAPKEHYVIGEKIMSILDAGWDACDRGINRIPAADVVPKSEVEHLEREIRLLTENSITAKYPHCVLGSYYAVLTKSLEDYDKVIADISSATKAEVAREIFAEIDNWFELYSEREYSFAEEETAKEHYPEAEAHDYALDIIKDLRQLCIAELKKKYIYGD